MPYPFPEHIKPCDVMIFVDGENLAIRWKQQIGEQAIPAHVQHHPDVFVWSELLNMRHHLYCNIIRKHYYTSVFGDLEKRFVIHMLGVISLHNRRSYYDERTRPVLTLNLEL
jgi:hypothetical protein